MQYEPAESRSGLFGGNSNWRDPIWFPANYLLIEPLQKFDQYLGNDFRVECSTGAGKWMTLAEVATQLSQRLTSIFLSNEAGSRRYMEEILSFKPILTGALYSYFTSIFTATIVRDWEPTTKQVGRD